MDLDFHKFKCPTCWKEYKREDYFKKHIILCDLFVNGNDEEIEDLPTINELYLMIKELAIKYKDCKKDCDQLKSKIRILEKKNDEISPEDYLIKHKRCDESFSDWVSNININSNNIKQLLNNNYLDVLCNIIKSNHNYNSPLSAFKYHKKNMIMIFNNKYWQELTNEHMKYLIDSIFQNILINGCEDIKSDYMSDVVKIVSEKGENYEEFRLKLFKQIKQNIML